MSTDEEKTAAFEYRVNVCTSILQAYPDAYISDNFAMRDFSKERQLDMERRWEAFQEMIRKEHPQAQPYALMFTRGLPEYGGSGVAGWRDILYRQREELERR